MKTEQRFIRQVLKYSAYAIIGGVVAFPVLFVLAFVIGLAVQFG